MAGAKAFKQEELLKDIGVRWDILGMQLKPYASCRWSHAAVDGLYQLMSQFQPEQVAKIDVYTFKFGSTALAGKHPTNMFQMQFSVICSRPVSCRPGWSWS
jgi:2-methylcitrate dehydratase PrpD